MGCPICEGRYYEVNRSDEVCDHHQGWCVTVCYACHKSAFSECDSVCPYCGRGYVRAGHGGSSKDSRHSLKSGGMEGWN